MVEIRPNSNLKNFTEKSAKGLPLLFLWEKKNLTLNESKCGQKGWKSYEKYVFQIDFEISTIVLERSREIFGFPYSMKQKSVVSHWCRVHYHRYTCRCSKLGPTRIWKISTNKEQKCYLMFFREKKILTLHESKCGQTGWKSYEKYVFQIDFEISTVVLEISREIFGFSYSMNQSSDVSHWYRVHYHRCTCRCSKLGPTRIGKISPKKVQRC